jgi:SAM-dependent methyltransferase
VNRRVVHKIEPGTDRREVEATTYQMRNFYRQLGDGYFSALDVFNYVQHHLIAKKLCRDGNSILDVCCGRGLLLPLLRYFAKPALYVGVDIAPENATFTTRRVTDGKPLGEVRHRGESFYTFPVSFVEAHAGDMARTLRDEGFYAFDLIVYTSSLEHMHPEVGHRSLQECRDLVSPTGRLVLTTPRTEGGRSGYDTRYAAHVYEWTRAELVSALALTGWRVVSEWGLNIGMRNLRAAAAEKGLLPLVESLSSYVPSEWLCPVLAPLFPKQADEIAFLAVPAQPPT